MSFQDGAAWVVVDGGAYLCGDVLNQGASAPGIEALQTLADGEDGLVEIEGVLEEELVDGSARCVSGRGFGLPGGAVFLGVDVGGAAWEKNSLHCGEDASDALRRLMERDGDWGGSGRAQGVEVLRQGALVIRSVKRSWFRDGDMYGLG